MEVYKLLKKMENEGTYELILQKIDDNHQNLLIARQKLYELTKEVEQDVGKRPYGGGCGSIFGGKSREEIEWENKWRKEINERSPGLLDKINSLEKKLDLVVFVGEHESGLSRDEVVFRRTLEELGYAPRE